MSPARLLPLTVAEREREMHHGKQTNKMAGKREKDEGFEDVVSVRAAFLIGCSVTGGQWTGVGWGGLGWGGGGGQ